MVPFFHVFPLDYRDNEWPDMAVCTPQRCRIYLHQPCSRSTQAFPGCSSEIVTMSQTKFVGVLSGANKFGRRNRAVFHEFEDLQILIDLIYFLEFQRDLRHVDKETPVASRDSLRRIPRRLIEVFHKFMRIWISSNLQKNQPLVDTSIHFLE